MSRRLAQAGDAAFALGLLGLALLQIVAGVFLSPVQPVASGWAGPAASRVHGVVLAVLALAWLMWPRRWWPRALLAAMLLAWLLLAHVPRVWGAPTSVVARVALIELLALGCIALLGTAMAADAGRRSINWATHSARFALGLMLVVFGATHLQYRDAIAGMVPPWMPARVHWPWFTGAASLAAGIGLLTGVLARWAALLAGAMFASWIVLVHAQRLASAPGSVAEWTFALTALSLTGAAWITAAALDASSVAKEQQP